MTINKVNRLIQICLDIADCVDEAGQEEDALEKVNRLTLDNVNLGYRALSLYLREGIKAVIDLKADYYKALERAKHAKESEKAAGEFLQDVFGDSDIDCINDADKARIRQFVRGIMEEWEKEDDE